jgi:[pyruvate, water dikinase]-phosphate phosphotransferase / [pyruvate, water dikinase] kinase
MPNKPPTILIISGGAGASAEQLIHTVLAQFPDSPVQVLTVSNVRFASQIDEAVDQARALGATLVHTLVDPGLRAHLVAQSQKQAVTEIDLMGPLIDQLAQATGQEPLSQPGLYRKLNKAYFERVAAIEYTIRHDDGQHPEAWPQAEVLLLGVSRSGKTPLSLYLSVLGWRAANLPLVPGLNLPAELFQIERRRVLGLKIEAGQLVAFRQQRQQRLGVSGPSDYTNLEKIYEELEYAAKIYRQNGFTTIQVTDKPIESVADEVIRLISIL